MRHQVTLIFAIPEVFGSGASITRPIKFPDLQISLNTWFVHYFRAFSISITLRHIGGYMLG